MTNNNHDSMQNAENKPVIKPKPAIIVDIDPEAEVINVSGGTGDVTVQAQITIKDKRVWAIIGLVVILVAGCKAAGLW